MLAETLTTTSSAEGSTKKANKIRHVASLACIVVVASELGINVGANLQVSGQTLWDAYIGQRTEQEAYLSHKMSSLGKSVTVNCTPLYEMGTNKPGDKVVGAGNVVSIAVLVGRHELYRQHLPIITLNTEDCSKAAIALHDAEHNDYHTSLSYHQSLGMLTHEFEHLYADDNNEASTECHNTQRLASRLEKLGYPPNDAHTISSAYARDTYRQPNYLSPECRPGGKLDLGIGGDYPQRAS